MIKIPQSSTKELNGKNFSPQENTSHICGGKKWFRIFSISYSYSAPSLQM
ncbi:MAG: hypothetical protein LBC13_03030 [Clostridiales bacterium]|nr:hypothetical protein [Clostridiales bacterium]